MIKMKHGAFIALTVLCQTTFAQSGRATIYGLVDLGVAKSNGGTAFTNGGPVGNKSLHLQQAAVSRLGFRGHEDLGGGFSAQFSLETRFAADTGTPRSPTIFWTGNSYVQVTKENFGSVWLGRNYIPAFYIAVKMDPFGWDGVGQHGLQQFGLYRGKEGPQASNIVGIKSARFFNSLTFDVSYSLGEDNTAKETGFNVQYSSGNLYAGMAYDKLSGGPAASNGNSLMNLGIAYNFGMIRPLLYASRSKTDGGRRTSDTIALGATAPLNDSGRLKMGYLRMSPDVGSRQQKYSLGYDHFLSKQTHLYIDGAIAKEDQKTDNRLISIGIKKMF